MSSQPNLFESYLSIIYNHRNITHLGVEGYHHIWMHIKTYIQYFSTHEMHDEPQYEEFNTSIRKKTNIAMA